LRLAEIQTLHNWSRYTHRKTAQEAMAMAEGKSMNRRPTLNTQQAADYLGCSRSYIFRMLDDGRLEGYRIGTRRGLRVFVDSLDRVIAERDP
jgi:excisionase family DNA binding protein